jgi:serine protease
MNSQLAAIGRRELLGGLGGALAPTDPLESLFGTDHDRVELIVGADRTASITRVAPQVAAETAATVRRIDETLGFATLEIPKAASSDRIETLESSIAARGDVEYVESVHRYYPQAFRSRTTTPSDPKFTEQHAPQQVNAPQAWRALDAGAQRDVTIAVIDQGTAYEHPDLHAQFGSNPGYDSTTIKAVPDEDDCEKKTDKSRDDDPAPEWLQTPVGVGWFCRDGYEIHGTHVSGIAAATTNRGTGIAGVSNATLLACRAVSMRGGRNDDIAASIRWAVDNGADLINISHGSSERSETMHKAITYARDNGVLPICAAGNDGGEVAYPAAFEETVAVSAVDESGEPTEFTARGPEIDVAGPGVDVLSTIPTEIPDRPSYERMSGTSMACPAVCGVAALGLAANPDWDADTLEQNLKDSARRIDGVAEKFQGAGIVDAQRLVGGASGSRFGNDDRVAATTDLTVRATPGSTARRIEVVPAGSVGYVRGGPRTADGYTWWEIEYNAGFQGWCAGSYLEAEPYTG